MRMTTTPAIRGWVTLALMTLLGCSDDGLTGSAMERDAASAEEGDEQTPPMGAELVEAWLEQGAYKTWRCEPAVHASRSPSPHGFNRICSNELIANMATGTSSWPRGAAAVKELYASLDGTQPIGYAVY